MILVICKIANKKLIINLFKISYFCYTRIFLIMKIESLSLIVHFLNFLKKRPLDGPLIESSSGLHYHFEENDGTLYSEKDVDDADFDNFQHSERHSVPHHLCFKDSRLPGCIEDSDECCIYLLTYLYVLWKKGCTVQGFLVNKGGILFEFFELMLRKYLLLLEWEESVILNQESYIEDFKESEEVAIFLSNLIEILEVDDEDDANEDENTRKLLVCIFDSVMVKYPGAISILHCANFQKSNIDNVTHDPEDLCKSSDGSILRSVHSFPMFPDDDDSFEGFPIHLGIWTSFRILQILLEKESVRQLDEDRKISVKQRVNNFLLHNFRFCKDFQIVSTILWTIIL